VRGCLQGLDNLRSIVQFQRLGAEESIKIRPPRFSPFALERTWTTLFAIEAEN
jgi:hypothetical protein